MKVEVNIKDSQQINTKNNSEENLPSCEVTIDIAQVLAANQALLKNMAKKIESLENKLSTMESVALEFKERLTVEKQMITYLNMPIKKIIEPWHPPKREKSVKKELTLADRFLRPWLLRSE